VFAAMVIYVGITLFDRPTLRLFKALQNPGKVRGDIFAILIVNIGVAIITVSVNLVWAVIIGLVISTVYFIIKTGISVIRREYTADLICSNKVRTWILHDRLGYRWIPSGNLCYYGGYEANP
jgi:MFS superfamily sulfate permease-like transporter